MQTSLRYTQNYNTNETLKRNNKLTIRFLNLEFVNFSINKNYSNSDSDLVGIAMIFGKLYDSITSNTGSFTRGGTSSTTICTRFLQLYLLFEHTILILRQILLIQQKPLHKISSFSEYIE